MTVSVTGVNSVERGLFLRDNTLFHGDRGFRWLARGSSPRPFCGGRSISKELVRGRVTRVDTSRASRVELVNLPSWSTT